MKRVLSSIVAVVCMAAAEVSVAQYGYTLYSLESLVARSDLVVRGTVTDVAQERVREQWVRKTVALHVQETLKGEHAPRLEFAMETPASHDLHERWQASRQEVLWFLARDEDGQDREAPESEAAPPGEPGWVPAAHWHALELVASIEDRARRYPPPPIYTLDLTLLERPEAILQAARRAAREEPEQSHPGHGVMLSRFLAQRTGTSGDANMFAVPVDRRLESAARRWIASPGDFIPQLEDLRWKDFERNLLRREGIKALQYFESDENIALLRGLLDDPAWLIRTRPAEDGPDIREKVYYIREAAYETLKGWEVDVERPILTEEP
jgi:hypothetical protein